MMSRHPVLFLMMFLCAMTIDVQAYSQTTLNTSDALSSSPSETNQPVSAVTSSQGNERVIEPSFTKVQSRTSQDDAANGGSAGFDRSGKATSSADVLYTELANEKNDFIVPEIAQAAVFSSVDVNRVVCPSEIRDVVYSKEKNVRVSFSKNNAFVKFLFSIVAGKEVYATRPVEFFIVCGDDIYNIIATPKKVPARTIRLSFGKAKKIRDNASLMGGLPLEKKVLQFIRFAYTDTLPDSFEVTRPRKRYRIWSELALVLDKTALVEGEGLLLKEFVATNVTNAVIRLNEKMFLIPDLTSRTLAVAIDPRQINLKRSESTRIFIVETTGGQSGGL